MATAGAGLPLDQLAQARATVLRTDLDGDLAVTVREGELGVVTSR